MFEVSCRKNFTSTTQFSDKLLFTKLPNNQRVFVAVHGYRAEYNNTLIAYKTIEDNIFRYRAASFDSVVGFYWPGSWSKTIGYVSAERRTAKSGVFLSELILELANRGNTIVLEGHSLGCKVVLESLALLPTPIISKFVLAAPAVDHDVLMNQYKDANRFSGQVMYSKNDSVLKVMYRLVPYNWFSPALGYTGPKEFPSSNLLAWDMTSVINGHSDYRNKKEFFELI